MRRTCLPTLQALSAMTSMKTSVAFATSCSPSFVIFPTVGSSRIVLRTRASGKMRSVGLLPPMDTGVLQNGTWMLFAIWNVAVKRGGNGCVSLTGCMLTGQLYCGNVRKKLNGIDAEINTAKSAHNITRVRRLAIAVPACFAQHALNTRHLPLH